MQVCKLPEDPNNVYSVELSKIKAQKGASRQLARWILAILFWIELLFIKKLSVFFFLAQ